MVLAPWRFPKLQNFSGFRLFHTFSAFNTLSYIFSSLVHFFLHFNILSQLLAHFLEYFLGVNTLGIYHKA
jgi:hypothetical protein